MVEVVRLIRSHNSASGDPDAPIFSGRVESWVHEEDVGGELTLMKSNGGRLRHAFINYTAFARDFAKTISQRMSIATVAAPASEG